MISVILPSKAEKNIMQIMKDVEDLQLPIGQIITCNDHEGRGKGYAVRESLKQCTGDLVVFLDADGDIEPRMLYRLMPYLADYDVVVGVKPISGLWQRRIITFLSRIYLAIMFDVKVDTQTGIKVFKREALKDWYNNGFLFDLEILCDAKKAGFRMIEVPIEANINRKVKMISLWNTFKESVTLFLETR